MTQSSCPMWSIPRFLPTLPYILPRRFGPSCRLLGYPILSRFIPSRIVVLSPLVHLGLPITPLLAFPPPPPLLPSFPSPTLTTPSTARHLPNATLCSKRVAGSQLLPQGSIYPKLSSILFSSQPFSLTLPIACPMVLPFCPFCPSFCLFISPLVPSFPLPNHPSILSISHSFLNTLSLVFLVLSPRPRPRSSILDRLFFT